MGTFGPSVERCFFIMTQIIFLRNKLTKLRFNCKETKSKHSWTLLIKVVKM